MGRFMSPDWAQDPEAVPYAFLRDPQTLNLYSYVSNNPLRHTDPDGHHQECGAQTMSTNSKGDMVVHANCVDVSDWWQFQGARRWLGKHPKTVKVAGAVVIGATALSGLADGGASELAVPEEIALEEALIEGGETAVEDAAETLASETAETAEGAANAEKTSGLEKQIAEHEQKLANYKSNPDAYDNKGILKNASPERRESIINGRIRHLEREIEAFRKSSNGK
jgi:hypothetical protein